MPETEGSQENIAYIRTHVDNIERMVWFQLASSPHRIAYVKDEFGGRAKSANVYMALSTGPKDQDALVKLTKLSQGTVSKICAYLEERNFIAKHRHPTQKQKLLFAWTSAEAALQLSRIAKDLIK